MQKIVTKIQSGVIVVVIAFHCCNLQLCINSSICLFADVNCIIYSIIDSEEDNNILQQDLNKIFYWAKTWQMNLNVESVLS